MIIELRTYRISYDTDSDRAFQLGLEAAKAGFTHKIVSINDSEHVFLSKCKLPFSLNTSLHEFQTDDEIPTCSKDTDLLDGQDYLTATLDDLLGEVFYDDDTEITLPSKGITLKITNHNAH